MTWPRKQSCAVLRPDFWSQTFFDPFNFTQPTKVIWTFLILPRFEQVSRLIAQKTNWELYQQFGKSIGASEIVENGKIIYLGSFGSILSVVAKVHLLHQN